MLGKTIFGKLIDKITKPSSQLPVVERKTKVGQFLQTTTNALKDGIIKAQTQSQNRVPVLVEQPPIAQNPLMTPTNIAIGSAVVLGGILLAVKSSSKKPAGLNGAKRITKRKSKSKSK